MNAAPDKSAQTLRFLSASLRIARAIIGWSRFID